MENTHTTNFGARTMRNTIALSLLVVALGGCAEAGPTRNRVQANIVDKSMFDGEWWYTRTVVNIEDDVGFALEQAGASAPWVGATADFDIVSNSGNIGRIRWVIDENYLYAYRAQEIVTGAASNPDDPNYRGQPLAIFSILKHLDVRTEYNSTTGEPTNVVSESEDRRWYDRQYMRVDWSQNLVTYGLFGDSLEVDQLLFMAFRREPVPFFVQEGGDSRFPDDWRPTFVRVGDDPTYRFASDWPADQGDTVHYMSFVTNELWTPLTCPEAVCSTAMQISVRHAFLRVPPNHDYATEVLRNSEYDRFGIIRTENRTYTRGGTDRSELGRHCTEDADCGGAACNAQSHLCSGGLSDEYGLTDFLNYYRLRHNFYERSLTDVSCLADWQCDNRYEATRPAADADGSRCDPAAHLCTIPMRSRTIRPVAYTLSPHFPTHLVRSAMQLVGSWNEAFMYGNRMLHGMPGPTGERLACQSTDPTQYCYCNATHSLTSPEVAAAGNADGFPENTCAHRSDYFTPPSQRGETNPYNCYITGAAELPHPQNFGDYGNEQYAYHFTSDDALGPSECMLLLRVNSCDAATSESPPREARCEAMGDLRYQFLNYTDAAGSGFCGVMEPMQDPTNGEALESPINMGGLCLDHVGTAAVDLWPLLRGEITEDAYFNGETWRNYFGNLNGTAYPVGLAPPVPGGGLSPDPSRPSGFPTDLNTALNRYFEQVTPQFERLRASDDARAQLFSNRVRQLQGTDIERTLVESMRSEGLTAVANSNPLVAMNLEEQAQQLNTTTTPDLLERMSPFRDGFNETMLTDTIRRARLSESYIEYPREGLFNARYQRYWANAFDIHDNYTLPEANIRWVQGFFRAVMLHELGHGLGMEHNFAGSLDRNQYNDGYYALVTQVDTSGNRPYALPRFEDFDIDRDGNLTGQEGVQWVEQLRRIRTDRANRGIGNFMSSSIMDYPGDYSDMSGLGHYDHAAIWFNYYNEVEAYAPTRDGSGAVVANGDPTYRAGAGTSLQGLQRADTTPRTLWTWYRGGDTCRADSDCPYRQGSGTLAADQGIWQRCVINPRFSAIPAPCTADTGDCVCSTFDEDFVDFVDGSGPYTSDSNNDGVSDYAAVRYLFCSNSRLNDISWCNTFDAGESFQEVIDHYRQMWQEGYPRNYFRNYRRGFRSGSRATQSIIDSVKMYQHLFYRYFYEPEFRRQAGPLGFNDQYLASVDSMNWLAELAQLPDIGSYQLDAATNSYRHLGEDMGMTGADFSLAPGQGFYTWSRYQDGLYGFFRLERAGVFWDKLIALRALTIRDWGLSFTIDERFFINYYDLFPVEMTELFGGYAINDDSWFAPRVRIVGGEPQVYYLNYLRGLVQNPTTGVFEPGRGSNAVTYTDPALQDTSNDILRLYAAIFALAEFPVFYDTSFERRLSIFKLENGDGFTIPDVQLDGQPTCGYRRTIPGSSHATCANPEDADYIIYVSDRLHTPYVATKQRPRLTYNLEEEQLGFQLLLGMERRQDHVRTLEAACASSCSADQRADLTASRRELQAGESFLEALIEVQRIFGITSWLF